MSHELRTPLNSLLILAQELAENPDGNLLPKQVEYATIIMSSGSDLLKLINDILDISKIESGTVALEITDWPLAELEPLLERTFRHVAEVTKLAFTIELAPQLPPTLPTDPQRLQQILNNLLSNAFKFTEKGKVEFKVGPVTSGWSNPKLSSADGVIAMSVADTGIGIPADMQRSIFEAFAQGDGTTSRKYGGTGLGLSICRELVGLLGGEIAVESEPGRGSTFIVYLPAGHIPPPRRRLSDEPTNGSAKIGPSHRSAAERRAPVLVSATSAGYALNETESITAKRTRRRKEIRSPERPREELATVLPQPEQDATTKHANGNGGTDPALANRRVLVVDDDIRNIFALTAMLERQGMQVISVDNGQDAIRIAGTDPAVEIALVDVMMPEMDGYATMRRMRELPTFKDQPIVALTAKAMKGDREKCIEAGASDYIAKPVNSEHLLSMLRAWLTTASPAQASLS
jgi:CheY-like chemotaxis protein